jgi:hypothetical protein
MPGESFGRLGSARFRSPTKVWTMNDGMMAEGMRGAAGGPLARRRAIVGSSDRG